MTKKLQSTPLKVTEYIKDRIELGELKPGCKIPSERMLVKQLSVSRSSVREAVKHLTTMGYLETFERKGTFISNQYKENQYANSQLNKLLNASSVFHLMEVRMLLEEKFIILAKDRITDEDIQHMKEVLQKIKSSEENTAAFLKADLAFHLALAQATHNEVIVEIMKVIIKRIYDNEEAFESSGKETKKSTVETFEKLLKYLQQNEISKAQEIYQEHLQLVNYVLKKSFE